MKPSKDCLACGFHVKFTTQLSVSGISYCKSYYVPNSVSGILSSLKILRYSIHSSDTDMDLLDGGLSQSGFETTEEDWNTLILFVLIALAAILGMAFYCFYCKRKT